MLLLSCDILITHNSQTNEPEVGWEVLILIHAKRKLLKRQFVKLINSKGIRTLNNKQLHLVGRGQAP